MANVVSLLSEPFYSAYLVFIPFIRAHKIYVRKERGI